MANDAAAREHLIWLLEGGHAHTKFDQAVKGFPPEHMGTRPKGLPYSAWQLLEHMRIAQHDMLRFSLSADHVSPPWPEAYWPSSPAPESENDWNKSIRSFRQDLAELRARAPRLPRYPPRVNTLTSSSAPVQGNPEEDSAFSSRSGRAPNCSARAPPAGLHRSQGPHAVPLHLKEVPFRIERRCRRRQHGQQRFHPDFLRARGLRD